MKKSLGKKKHFGAWITLGHLVIAEIMCQAGFDWLVVDMEHSAITLAEAQNLIQIIQLSGVVALVRVSHNDPIVIKQVMDAGADGVIVPMVNSAEEARAVVQSVHYPPDGIRGVGLARAQGYGMSFKAYAARLKRETIIIVQVEHRLAVENLEEIFAVPGVDGFLVGPYDLSGSYGVPGQFDHPQMKKAIARIMHVSRRMNIPAGVHVIQPSESELASRIKAGFKFIALSLDSLYLALGCREFLKKATGSSRGNK
jgi:2-dehydro-3-deoxyglucarate aldolase